MPGNVTLFPNYRADSYNSSVHVRILSLFLLLLAGCAKAPQNQDAVKQAITDHLGKRKDMLMQQMKIDIVSVSFRDKEADAVVSISPKEGGQGMQMTYSLLVEGGKWVVKPAAANPHGNAPRPSGQMPPGHPSTEPKAHP